MNVRSHNKTQCVEDTRVDMIAAFRYVVLKHEEPVRVVVCEGSLQHGQDAKCPHENLGGEWVVS